ncbi:MAG: hypothetical protein ACLPKT_00700 [Methylocella sp.]
MLSVGFDFRAHPLEMFGRFGDGRRFRRDELIYALASDGRSWTREPRETAEAFEARIVRDLVEAAHTGREEPILVG